jgi:uncharacterized glyoxalase superfamily protein PhnB
VITSVDVKNNRSIPDSTVIPVLAYASVPEAAEWLCGAFGFRKRLLIADHRAQLSVGDGGAVVVAQLPEGSVVTRDHSVMVRIADAASHHERAKAFGAVIVSEPVDYPYGERQYTARDFAGHTWTFSETIADSDPEGWGGTFFE